MTTEKPMLPLNKCIREAIESYFAHLDGHKPTKLYKLVLAEVEPPLLKAALKYTNNNNSKAATALGISRGTLRKLLKQYKLD